MNHNFAQTNNLHRQTKALKEKAVDLGFSLVGIAPATAFDTEFRRYQEWLQRGYHATLGYMERNAEKRRDVNEILPGARSVVVVAQNYYSPPVPTTIAQDDNPNTSGRGKVSRYAWGDDYHDVIKPKLVALDMFISTLSPGTQSRYYTDTGPVLEKQWAVRAGIGWQGKHSNIIARDLGSWFFLGVLITTAEFIYDTPQSDYCGTCTACMDACPTQAIVEPRVVDAGRCISYWTIETKPDVQIPAAIAHNMDGWLLGCDTCQDVCPWNRFQKPNNEQQFESRFPREADEVWLPLHTIQTMQQEEFSTTFRRSPVKRAKLAGLQRNALALLGGDS